MKKLLSLVLTFTLLLSVCSVAAQEGSGEDLPVIKKPVEITVTDDLGEPLPGVSVQLTDEDNNVLEAWQSDGSKLKLYLEEGQYKVDGIEVPEGYLLEDPLDVAVELTEDEQNKFVGHCSYNHTDNTDFCNDPSHVGFELYSINGQTAYCFNHCLANPNGSSEYIMQIASPDFLWDHALNKKVDETADLASQKQALYDHVLGIIYHSKDLYNSPYNMTEAQSRWLTYMAIKSFTDCEHPAFKNYYDDGTSTYDRVNHVFKPGGTVWGSVVHHAAADYKNVEGYDAVEALSRYKTAYDYLRTCTTHPDYHLYIYYPTNWDAEGGGFQCLITGQQVIPKKAAFSVREATSVKVFCEWNDQNDKNHKRPSVEAFAAALELFADGSNVTDLYRSGLTVEDRGGTYVISFSSIPKRNDAKQEISYVVRASAFGYQASIDLASNGDTIVFTYTGFGFIPIDHGIIKPIKPIKPVRPAPRFTIGF